MSNFTLREMIIHGWPVLTVLLVMSILSITVIVDRGLAFRAARVDARAFVANLLRILESHDLGQAIKSCARYHYPIAGACSAVLCAPPDREARERAARHALQGHIHHLESYLPSLATVASTAPFVGLFGTVVGIIRAFRDIAGSAGGGPQVVSAGISEALITTACGLFVAIPAVIGYNIFTRLIQRLSQSVDMAVYELIEHLERKG
jgi:biopolymer transport protein ExbB/TolQ